MTRAAIGPAIKAGALILWFVLWAQDAAGRAAAIEGAAGRTVFAALAALAWIGIGGAAIVRHGGVRWALALLFAAGTLYVAATGAASGQYLTYEAHINLVGSAGFLGDALAQNGQAFAAGALHAALAALAIGLTPPARLAARGGRAAAALPAAIAMGLTALLFWRGGDGAKGLPAAYTAFAYTALERYEALRMGAGPREPVRIAHRGTRPYRHVVLLIDESVAARYLDTGNPGGGVPTPLSAPWPGVRIANFGVAAAITNCSIGSNLALRYGATRRDYRRQIARAPSLWSYAKAAGYRTVYLDAQRTGGAFQNGMDADERRAIDRFVQFAAVPVAERDHALAAALAAETRDPRPSFIIANKIGAHFPVQDKFPDSFARYLPIPPRGGFLGVSDTGSRAGFGGSARDWALYRNAYRNTLAWNVSAFFTRVLGAADWPGTLMVYTSDHGQDLHEDGRSGTTTHCQPDPRPAEGAVPLIVLSGADAPFAFAPRPASHYALGATLLAAMGYDRAAVRARHGPALDEADSDPMTFNAAFNARLGKHPDWRIIDPARLPLPPEGDARP